MIFYFAKKETECKWCGAVIQKKDFCVRQFIHNRTGNSGYLITYHYDCFVQATIEHIRKEAVDFLTEHNTEKKLGRPPIYADPKEANKLRRLIRYHREKGHVTKINELEVKLAMNVRHL